ncbi:hypothetical protein FDP41_010429 [Naegleria fowleri]|uniref:BTB domain-containing protein n=1 Tax=Naegleria fowleri TaxID=5763 RepID=A0A6A5CA06_NAEFO|nr:uncharacterized protein FDP41_010429 [Naegleria fowleri]KAF0983364.1 hypothetical protein FDP41_010429 [Naegleria fowleri]CAG4718371.1 unnamed protein product [Naegleria fowleri]
MKNRINLQRFKNTIGLTSPSASAAEHEDSIIDGEQQPSTTTTSATTTTTTTNSTMTGANHSSLSNRRTIGYHHHHVSDFPSDDDQISPSLTASPPILNYQVGSNGLPINYNSEYFRRTTIGQQGDDHDGEYYGSSSSPSPSTFRQSRRLTEDYQKVKKPSQKKKKKNLFASSAEVFPNAWNDVFDDDEEIDEETEFINPLFKHSDHGGIHRSSEIEVISVTSQQSTLSQSLLEIKTKLEQDLEKEYISKKTILENELKTALEQEKNLEQDCKIVKEEIEMLTSKLHTEKGKWAETTLHRIKLEKSTKPVTLNVGGKRMKASLSVLMDTTRDPNSVIAKMFNGEFPLRICSDGSYFIDCEESMFKLVLHWLRYGKLNIDCEVTKERLSHVAEYFGLDRLKAILKDEIYITNCESNSSELRIDTDSNISQAEFSHLVSVSKYQKKPLVITKTDLTQLQFDNMTFTDAEIVDCNLSGLDIRGTHFKGCSFKSCDFSSTKFKTCNFASCDFSQSNFSKAEFLNSTLSHSKLTRCHIDKATFKNTKFDGTDLTQVALSSGYIINQCSFSGSTFNEETLRNASSLKGNNFSKCSLIGFNLSNLDFSECDFSHANLSNCNFSKTKLYQCNLSHANLTYCKLDGCSLKKTDLTGAILFGCDLKTVSYDGFNISGCKLNGALFDVHTFHASESVTGIDFRGCNLDGFDFSDLDLSNSYFEGTKLDDTNFMNCNLTNATFVNCDLRNANLHNSNITFCNFNKCKLHN